MIFMEKHGMRVSLVVAAAENNAIGRNNELIWKLSADLKFFKHLTWAMPVVMGRKTFDSVGKPLNGRINIVITRQQDWASEGVQVASSLEEALALAADADCKEVFIIGGAEIYRQSLPIADRVYLTRVQVAPEADAFFPALSSGEWKLVADEPRKADAKNEYDFRFQTWDRT